MSRIWIVAVGLGAILTPGLVHRSGLAAFGAAPGDAFFTVICVDPDAQGSAAQMLRAARRSRYS